MNYIKRDMENLILETAKEYAAVLIIGPRQVGKSTILNKLFKDTNKVTLDDLQERNLAKNDPELFLKLHSSPIIIDEVQYAPELFSYIKIEIDKGAKPGSFLLTGSQAFKLMDLAQESLAGRIAILHLTSLSQHETNGLDILKPFSLDIEELKNKKEKYLSYDINYLFSQIFHGQLPGYVSKKYTNRNIFYSSYLETYISHDVLNDQQINKGKFLDFIRAAACRIGQVLNVHSLASDVDISDDTAKRWLNLLEKSEIIYFLHPYSNNLLKRVIKAPKLYFFDTGLVAYLTKYNSPQILLNGAINGAILENYVINEIRKNYLNLGEEPPLYYYHDKNLNEIDLIIISNGLLYPIEIKKTNNPNRAMVKSFSKLTKASLPMGKGAIICTKEELSAIDKDLLIIPIWLI